MCTPNDFRAQFLAALLVASSVVRGALAQTLSDPSSAPAPEEPAASAASTSGPRPLAESLEGEAKRAYELGCLLYDNGDYAGALVRFESARKASADARLLWNVAVCQK